MAGGSKQKEPFWLGGAAASMAVCFTHPLDQTKYRMQLLKSRESMFRAMYRFAARDGFFSLWSGLSASIFRQTTYSTARFGLYNYFAQQAKQWTGQEKLTTAMTISCAGLAGGMAGLVGNPAEVVLVRMCADGAKNVGERFAYSNAVEGLYRIGREEGVGAFTRGISANVVRSILMNVGQIATYSTAKRILLQKTEMKDDIKTHAVASLFAGTAATTICAPADVLKSRIQSAAASGPGANSLLRIVQTGLREEGAIFLMKGWTPAWLRLTPNTVLTFVFMEQLRKLTQWQFAAPVETMKA
ncbi:mitochondrial dicarboxylate transporter [Colletotrichum acutatum]|uniref:Mitochondrial dicarboxylate transporter n=1 Tax=Glomerella acutata TaxID=27357 RepID=A0AAD8XD37_GLOAC|nr:mitochondrial dicarboxylate transporter [Colletotrichum acutatum]KAK1722772.1 mitochondrial dicarboxylate transporter [Colletotrichum acutatum]